MVIENHVKLCVTKPDFSKKFSLPRKRGKRAENGQTMRFFPYFRKLSLLLYTTSTKAVTILQKRNVDNRKNIDTHTHTHTHTYTHTHTHTKLPLA